MGRLAETVDIKYMAVAIVGKGVRYFDFETLQQREKARLVARGLEIKYTRVRWVRCHTVSGGFI